MKFKVIVFIFLTNLFSCTTLDESTRNPPSPPEVSNRDLWLHRNGDELLLHPIYASLPVETRTTSTGIKVMSFRNSGGTISDQDCNISSYYNQYNSSSYSGCNETRVEVACNHVFYLKKNLITDYKRIGECFKDRFDFRPHNKKGEPVITESEKEYIKKLEEFNKTLTCDSNADCNNGLSCQENTCQNLGLWGRLVNP